MLELMDVGLGLSSAFLKYVAAGCGAYYPGCGAYYPVKLRRVQRTEQEETMLQLFRNYCSGNVEAGAIRCRNSMPDPIPSPKVEEVDARSTAVLGMSKPVAGPVMISGRTHFLPEQEFLVCRLGYVSLLCSSTTTTPPHQIYIHLQTSQFL